MGHFGKGFSLGIFDSGDLLEFIRGGSELGHTTPHRSQRPLYLDKMTRGVIRSLNESFLFFIVIYLHTGSP